MDAPRQRTLAMYAGAPPPAAGKVAVLLYGLLRTFETTAPSFMRHVVTPNDADVFYFGPEGSDNPTAAHTGQLDVFGTFKSNPKRELDPVKPVDASLVRQAYGARLRAVRLHNVGIGEFQAQCVVNDPADWIYNLNPVRLYSMFYNMKGAVELLAEYERQTGTRYDSVVLTRPDIAFFSPVVARPMPGELHIPTGEGIDGWGVKHRGNARVLYYRNVRTGDFLEGGDRITFNDQLFVLARKDLDRISECYAVLSDYLASRVPPSPETLLFLHLVGRCRLKPVEHDEWCYMLYRKGMALEQSVLDTGMLALLDRRHPRAIAWRRAHPLLGVLRDLKILSRKLLHRIRR